MAAAGRSLSCTTCFSWLPCTQGALPGSSCPCLSPRKHTWADLSPARSLEPSPPDLQADTEPLDRPLRIPEPHSPESLRRNAGSCNTTNFLDDLLRGPIVAIAGILLQ